jgi:3-isopropylmalate/(R)-2-methylmalate dehydratase small subunit
VSTPTLRLPVLTGRAWTFADDLQAADILPLRYGGIAAGEARTRLFADHDAALAAQLAHGAVLVAGQNLGTGPGAAPAAAALAAAGIVAVVGTSLAPDFAAAALAVGLAPLEVDAPSVFHTGQRLRLNLEGGTIANLSSGDRQPIRNFTEAFLERLRERLGR